jgi:hypothetical protein
MRFYAIFTVFELFSVVREEIPGDNERRFTLGFNLNVKSLLLSLSFYDTKINKKIKFGVVK